MKWNWQQADWPNFTYRAEEIEPFEERFLLSAGRLFGASQHLDGEKKQELTIELISDEAQKTSEIEGEMLNRDSLQSSIRRQFGLATDARRASLAEQGVSEMMVDLYRGFDVPLTNKKLCDWHRMLMKGRTDLTDIGVFRTHEDAMQVVSGAYHAPRVHFEAPPSAKVQAEMDGFIGWFNRTAPQARASLPIVVRAGIAHLYFESIHPFEDGNGRIGRAIAEKVMAEGLRQPSLIALAYTIEREKKAYYAALEAANKSNEITEWLLYFADTILKAQETSLQRVDFIIEKGRLYQRLAGQLNPRQEKALDRVFRAGLDGFKGGFSAENYISITKTSRATATRDLQGLVELGAFRKVGERKHTRYYINLPSVATNP
ncbi:Fic family protein [Ruficoccus amylovorans]|uniref:Fic family protein n=1 Tax=Ruficoccus amylovorans TaxID=1804625 RepID=A0A842HIY0_9BACT|nr:Fic family protein [Ruficoccus amylovorans]MBC2595938.1 Fic family protein [Ruficoccus amylovorans]